MRYVKNVKSVRMAALNDVKYVKKNCQIIVKNKTKYTKAVSIVLNIRRQERNTLFLSVRSVITRFLHINISWSIWFLKKRSWKMRVVIKERCKVLWIHWFLGKTLWRSLLLKEKFFSRLNNKEISDQITGLHKVWSKFKFENVGEYIISVYKMIDAV